MKIEMTPLKLQILIWYYYSPGDYQPFNAPAVQNAIKEFVDADLMYYLPQDHDRVIGIRQEAIDLYIDEILKVPLPVKKWVIEKPSEPSGA